MRNACFAALLFAIATVAAAEQYGPIAVDQLPSPVAPPSGGYFEYRFAIRNESAEQHTVRIDIRSITVFRAADETHSSRQFTVRARATEFVRVPQYVSGPNYVGPSEALVTIDGRDQRGRFNVSRSSGADTGGRPEVLIGRNMPQAYVQPILPTFQYGVPLRADLPPGEWSDQWIQYGHYGGALMTSLDWTEMPPPVRNAMLRWVAAGGALIFFGLPPQLPQLRPAPEIRQFQAGHYGFGTIGVLGNEPVLTEAMLEELRAQWHRGNTTPEISEQMNDVMPILDKSAIPVGSMFSLLILFAIAGGPASLIVLARKDKRVWIFGVLPLLAIATAGTVIGALIVHEGFARIQKTTSLTLLDETRGEAATIGWTGFYATFPPNGKVRFDYDSEVRPFFYAKAAHTDWTDGQRFMAGWIDSRVPSHFALRKCEPRRERVPIRIDGGRVFALNGLGAAINDLQVALNDGAMFRAEKIPAGKEVLLTRTGRRVNGAIAKDPSQLFGPPMMWHSFYSRVTSEPEEYLQPGTYVAVLETSPFVEQALEHPSRVTSQAVVIGFMKGNGDAS
jgi:hypothetical protein